MTTLANDIEITSVGITPNPADVSGTVLIQIGVESVDKTWSDWSSFTWAYVSSLAWGA